MSKNVYEMVTNRILEQLESGCVPWNRPWSGTFNQAYNRISKKPYSLLNQMLLKYPDEYITFNQATDLGGKVKKGANVIRQIKCCLIPQIKNDFLRYAEALRSELFAAISAHCFM